MRWCEDNRVDYVLGLARNARLKRLIGQLMQEAKVEHQRTGKAARRFGDFDYRTRKSWSRERRVVVKAEYLPGKENPRFVVTSLSISEADAQHLYEVLYCARGEMENRIKEQQLGLFADRTSCHAFKANQFRLLLSSAAYVLVEAIRRIGLKGTELARAQVQTIRLRLFKIAARVTRSVRRIVFHLASSYPYQVLLARILARLKSPSSPALTFQ